MNQTLVSIAALGCIVVYSVQSRRASHRQHLQAVRSQVEAHAAEVGADLLDRAGSLPFSAASLAPAPSFASADALDQWDGLSEVVAIATADDTLRYAVRAVVDPVERNGTGFSVATTEAPFRRVKLAVMGELEVAVTTERVYTDLNR